MTAISARGVRQMNRPWHASVCRSSRWYIEKRDGLLISSSKLYLTVVLRRTNSSRKLSDATIFETAFLARKLGAFEIDGKRASTRKNPRGRAARVPVPYNLLTLIERDSYSADLTHRGLCGLRHAMIPGAAFHAGGRGRPSSLQPCRIA